MANNTNFIKRWRKRIAATGIGVRTDDSQADSSVAVITAASGAASASDPNGSLHLRSGGVPEVRLGGAWKTLAVEDQTFDSGSAGIKADVVAESTGAAGVTVDGLLIKDSAIAPVVGGSAFLDLTSAATGEGDVILADNLASALMVRESTTAYQTFVTTNNSERVQSNKPQHAVVGMWRESQAEFYDDFIADVGATLPVPWVSDAQTANVTLDYLSGAGAGVIRMLTDSTSEAQAININYGDALHINMSNNPIFEFRVRVSPAGAAFTADERLVIGLGSAHATGEAALDDVVTNAWFRIEGASLTILVEADDGTNDTNDQSSTITLVKDAWTIFRIDCADLTDIKYYVDGVEQGGATVTMTALGANTFVQPMVVLQRDAGTEANSLDIDYIKVIVDR